MKKTKYYLGKIIPKILHARGRIISNAHSNGFVKDNLEAANVSILFRSFMAYAGKNWRYNSGGGGGGGGGATVHSETLLNNLPFTHEEANCGQIAGAFVLLVNSLFAGSPASKGVQAADEQYRGLLLNEYVQLWDGDHEGGNVVDDNNTNTKLHRFFFWGHTWAEVDYAPPGSPKKIIKYDPTINKIGNEANDAIEYPLRRVIEKNPDGTRYFDFKSADDRIILTPDRNLAPVPKGLGSLYRMQRI